MANLTLKCEVCDSLIDDEDLFCANCGTEAPKREASRAPGATRESTHKFECSGCGASMSFDPTAGSLRCPFCGSLDMVQQEDGKVLAPERVVPFKVARDEADARMRQWLGNGFFRPGDLSRQAAIVKMTPVYVPYWVFEARTHTYWTADTSQTPPGARGDWYPMSGDHHGDYANLLIGASGALSPAETSALCPFDLAEGVAPEQADLENVTTEEFSVPRKYARPLARQSLEYLEAQAADAEYVPGRSRNVHANVRIESMSSEPVLLPVWIMAYRYKGRVFRFLVNGQTGRATGQAPFSWKKLLLIVAAVALALLAIAVCMGLSGVVAANASIGDHAPYEFPVPAAAEKQRTPTFPPTQVARRLGPIRGCPESVGLRQAFPTDSGQHGLRIVQRGSADTGNVKVVLRPPYPSSFAFMN